MAIKWIYCNLFFIEYVIVSLIRLANLFIISFVPNSTCFLLTFCFMCLVYNLNWITSLLFSSSSPFNFSFSFLHTLVYPLFLSHFISFFLLFFSLLTDIFILVFLLQCYTIYDDQFVKHINLLFKNIDLQFYTMYSNKKKYLKSKY